MPRQNGKHRISSLKKNHGRRKPLKVAPADHDERDFVNTWWEEFIEMYHDFQNMKYQIASSWQDSERENYGYLAEAQWGEKNDLT